MKAGPDGNHQAGRHSTHRAVSLTILAGHQADAIPGAVAHRRAVYLPAHVFAARKRFTRYRHLEHLKKNQAPELLPRPDPHGARGTSARIAIHGSFHFLEGWFDMPDLGAVLLGSFRFAGFHSVFLRSRSLVVSTSCMINVGVSLIATVVRARCVACSAKAAKTNVPTSVATDIPIRARKNLAIPANAGMAI
jgi:hypothetical protein